MRTLVLAEDLSSTKLMRNSSLNNTEIGASITKKHQSNFNAKQVNHTQHYLKIYIIVDTKWVTTLRQLIIKTFSGIVSLIRIEPIDHAKKMKVCLYFNGAIEDKLMTSIMRGLPSAEFGRITSAQ